jgi:hypothetical protein
MNKLKQPLFTKKPWGSEIVWALNDNFMAKTIEIEKGRQTPLVVHDEKEKVLKVIRGPLYLVFGGCCDESTVPMYKVPTGWTWPIDPGMIHRYKAMDEYIILEEVSTPQLEDGVILVDEEGIEISPTPTEIEALVRKAEEKPKEKEKPKKRKRRTKK